MFRLTRTDRLLLFFLLSLALSLFLARALASGKSEALSVQVELNGRIMTRFYLPPGDAEETVSVTIPRGYVRLSLTRRGVRILPMPRSLCPRGICSHSGWIGRPGETLICAPNRLVLRIVARNSPGIHAVAR